MGAIVSLYNLEKDNIINSIVVTDSDHHEVHRGEMFKLDTYKTALADGGTYSIYWTNLSSKYMHIKKVELWANNAEVWADLYKNLTATTTGGKSVVAYNCNQTGQATSTSGIVFKASATVTVGTAIKLDRYIAGGGGANQGSRIGDSSQASDEWILQNNKKCGIRITNKSGGAANFHIKIRFYNELGSLG